MEQSFMSLDVCLGVGGALVILSALMLLFIRRPRKPQTEEFGPARRKEDKEKNRK